MIRALYPGTWDLLHPGHLFALNWASKQCDHLTAALNIDPTIDDPTKAVPIESDVDRFCRLLSCKFVDSVVYYEGQQELETLCRSRYYDAVFISAADEESYVPVSMVKPIFVPRLSEHSTTQLVKQIRED